ncbi:hypothetical protein J1N35_005098 [Gossypium stocksii]|uniref:Uncharacterized protein n=1 Tax=Gossypium stocksii TaxID=47602 RepID=A0A9D4AIN9_9ROSI|nr:hypothetical protein J1N35_005098 [Gossypium stocksii]
MLLMAMAMMKMVVMGNHELGRRNPIGKGKALGLGSSVTSVEAKEAEREKKPMECLLCHGLHRLRKCPKKSVIEGDNRVDKKPKKLGSRKGKVKAKGAKRSKKKRVKCFLCRGPHQLRNYPKQAAVKGKTTLSRVSHRRSFHPRKRVGRVIDKASTYGRGGWGIKLQGKKVMQVTKLIKVNATSRIVRVKKQHKRGKSLKGREKLRCQDETEANKLVPFGSHNEGIAIMGAGECHGP